MKPFNIEEALKNGEGQHIEFKLKSNHPEKIMKELVAFANTSGGYLILGVSDDLKLNGLKFPQEDLFTLEKAIGNLIEPKLPYEKECMRVMHNKEILVFTVPKSDSGPHYLVEKDQKTIFVRVKDRSIQASKEMRDILKEQNKNKNLRFNFGEKEKILFEYLEEKKTITVKTFMELASIPRRTASRTLILLVLTSVLKILPNEKEDHFLLNNN